MKILFTDSDRWYTNNNFRYILWFQPSFGIIAFSSNTLYILLDSRYIDKIENIDKQNIFELLNIKKIKTINIKKNYIHYLNKITSKSKNIYLENQVPYYFIEKIKKLKKEVKIKNNFFEKKRIFKNNKEEENIKKAIKVIDNVFKQIEKLNKKNKLQWKTELEIRWIIISLILENQAEAESFESIVAFWKNSAIPHHTSWNTIIKDWPLLIDMWALYNWYCSDFTRTFWVWDKNTKDYSYKEFKEIYKVVKTAHNKAITKFKIDIKAKEIDKAARDYIKLKWYWEYFTHSTGHWLWINIHEKPWINSKSNIKLQNWMFFTIEPWIYLKNNFWIRLENIVHVKNNKLKIYSKIKI